MTSLRDIKDRHTTHAPGSTASVETVQPARSRVASVAAPIYLLLFPIPAVLFVAAVFTDVAYSASAFLMWLHFSQWLIAAGLAFGVFAAIALLVVVFANGVARVGAFGWSHLALFYAALVIEIFNAFIHTADGWTAVVPIGMLLSIVGAICALAAVGTLFFVPVAWVSARGARA